MKSKIIPLLLCLIGALVGCVSTSNTKKEFIDIAPNEIASVLSPGWNLGNQLEGVTLKTNTETGKSVTWPSETAYMDTKITKELLVAVKKEGFKFVRIPISFFAYIDDSNNYQIDPTWMARIKEVVDMTIDTGLYAMLDLHGDGYYSIKNSWLLCAEEDQTKIIEKYRAVWTQLAVTFRDYSEYLIFESMNEVFDGNYSGPIPAAYENINTYNQVFVDTVRGTGGNNTRRWLLIPGWNTDINATVTGIGTEGNFRMPEDDRLMVSVHYYDPWGFAGGENGVATQWGSFGTNKDKVNGYEGAMAIQFNKLRDTFTSKGIPVVIGEWGSIDKTTDDPDSPFLEPTMPKNYRKMQKELEQFLLFGIMDGTETTALPFLTGEKRLMIRVT
jgi:endoglucanase